MLLLSLLLVACCLQEQRAVYQEFRQQAPSEAVEEALAILLRGAVMQDDSEAVTWVPRRLKGVEKVTNSR